MARVHAGRHAFKMIDATKLLLGNRLMDEQHAALVELFNILEKPEADLGALGPAFASYADFHFEEEESLMRRYHYPAMAAHMADHQDYRAQFERMMRESLSGPGQREAMQTYVATWLAKHILGTDKELAEFLHAAGYER
jgi:hemerythrin